LRPILDYIDAHYMEKPSMHQIADAKGISHFYLSHLFKEKVGVSFNKYVNSIRVGKVLDLLAYSEQKIVDIIYACGFSGPEFFYRIFKETQRCTPIEYRMRYRHRSQGPRNGMAGSSASQPRGVKSLAEEIVNKLLVHLKKLPQDRPFGDKDKAALLAIIYKNDPRQSRYFANVHFSADSPSTPDNSNTVAEDSPSSSGPSGRVNRMARDRRR
jgi:AraC-like DNA-binding protein